MLLVVYYIVYSGFYMFGCWMLHVTCLLSIYSPDNCKFALRKMVKRRLVFFEMVRFQGTFVIFSGVVLYNYPP